MKKKLFYLGHPAHFHLFKHTIHRLIQDGFKVVILIKKKDILEDILNDSRLQYINILPEGRKDNKLSMGLGVVKRDWRLFTYCLKNKPDLLVGTSIENGHVGKILGIPSINVNEDDHHVVPLYAKLSYPFSSCILSPTVCENGKWEHKSVKYNSYHELAYLHPNHFVPSKTILEKYMPVASRYFVLRFAKLGAHHDKGIDGLSNELALQLVSTLEPHGKVIISSERTLTKELEKYRMRINPLDMHHIMAFAALYIGDSQTMAAEAGVLGVPFIRYNDFVGRIGYLNDIENKYGLGFGIKSNNKELLFEKINELINTENLKSMFQAKRTKMLNDKTDASGFLYWFIKNYPHSYKAMKENPDIEYSLPTIE